MESSLGMRLRSLHVSVPIYCHMVAVCQEVSAEKCLLRSVCREVSAEKCLPNSIMVYSRSLSIVIGSGGRTEIRSGGGGGGAVPLPLVIGLAVSQAHT